MNTALAERHKTELIEYEQFSCDAIRSKGPNRFTRNWQPCQDSNPRSLTQLRNATATERTKCVAQKGRIPDETVDGDDMTEHQGQGTFPTARSAVPFGFWSPGNYM
jgi:hypothetical protein